MLRRCASRGFSTAAKASAPKPEYPKSFLSHLANQPLNAFNIGVTVLTLSLSIQLVNATSTKNDLEKLNRKLESRVSILEDRLKEFGVEVPTEDEIAKAAEAEELRKIESALEEKAKNAPKTKGVMV